ncbi:hypothetical protein [Gloeobacter morelensis]|uniref:Uncharacterized protein n=1 Tax=Gloeobacter morelensis MG652769 TaxID=2781736 RepID=A0ABY3PQW9_9CYAN|nr:hypothetical protein [Gloeobacter morelensis]UFP96092.1 hypothetical protein ISF26_07745 [Gloeobacter morelensis MG652769]
MPFQRSRSEARPPKLRLPIVFNREECEALTRALQTAIDAASPGSDELALLYTLLRKAERLERKLTRETPTDWDTLDDD